jgi:hypothetical protein
MTDPRPRPKYGEYATPQAQAEAMGLPTPANAGVPAAAGAVPATPVVTRVRQPGQVNVIATVVLLAIGLLNIATSFSSYLDLPATIQSVYSRLDYGTYTSIALASSLGVVVAVLSVLIWISTAAVSALLLKRHRLAWWVPVAGAGLLFVVVAIVMTVAVLSDPAFSAYLAKVGA